MITAAQLRAARALLGIDQRRLAELSGLSAPTIQRMEASEGVIRGNVNSLMKLVGALDAAGIELIADGAVSASGGRGVRTQGKCLSMAELLAAVVLLLLGGLAAVALRARPRACQIAGQIGAVAGSVVGLSGAIRVLIAGRAESITGFWPMPGGSLHLELDMLSAFFLLPVFGLTLAAAVYGRSYLAGREVGQGAAGCWFHFNLLTTGMALVIVARDGLLFLLAWEIMALSPVLPRRCSTTATRRCGAPAWTYLAATHLGTAFLLVMFVVLGAPGRRVRTSTGLCRRRCAPTPSCARSSSCWRWSGSARRPASCRPMSGCPRRIRPRPSHASALMSGAMIKVGIYGLLRMLTLLGAPPAWWGWLLLAAGASSGILGVLFALAQHDLKRLLAYHSVENIGIILIGIGIGVLGFAAGVMCRSRSRLCRRAAARPQPQRSSRACCFSAPARCSTRRTRSTSRNSAVCCNRMPWTGATFLIGAAAIVGLPPLNGFVSEFLLFYRRLSRADATGAAIAAGRPGLGRRDGADQRPRRRLLSPRPSASSSSGRRAARRPPRRMKSPRRCWWRWPALAALCAVIGLAAPAVVVALSQVVAAATGLPAAAGPRALAPVPALSLAACRRGVRRRDSRRRARLDRGAAGNLARAGVRRAPVWGCGYLLPTARMQYTASSFAQPLMTQFRLFVRNRETLVAPPSGYFPQSGFLCERQRRPVPAAAVCADASAGSTARRAS